jgi:Flp pilus assembly protein TadB
MKIPSLFTKVPGHKRFNYVPRHYDAREEQRKEREERIKKELQSSTQESELTDYRQRITGSFRLSRKNKNKSFDPSANLLRLFILTLLVVWLIAYLQYGTKAVYALALLIPFYVWIRFIRK